VRRLSKPEVEELIAARLAGEEIAALADRFQVARSTVIDHLNRYDVPGRRWPGRTLTAEQLQAAGQLYASGLRLELVGERFGVDRRYLRRVLPTLGIDIRPAGQQRQR